ncbi:Nucleic acid-binding, OB-fold-like protein isoform 2 [Hibiscus syriacus]|uniref:Nucleic acid-binding, OB-fold-like protein isoform 2 n=1 Tax=Hibiscus syriacus TaxID=106335 RepID=A0A6A3CN55_HIBSY|nr:Nucleic acid-binding, OB-fold-like protein isoform 2 [Hibiscus syriacus]
MEKEDEIVTPGVVLGRVAELKARKGAYVASQNNTIYASLTGFRQPGSVVIARVTKVMARTASADIMCVGSKSVREKFTGIIRCNNGSNKLDGDAVPIDGPNRAEKGGEGR